MKIKEQVETLEEIADRWTSSSSSAEITIGERAKDILENESTDSDRVRVMKEELKELIIVCRYLLAELRK